MIRTTGFLKSKGSISRPNWRFYEIKIKTEIEDFLLKLRTEQQ
jgi:hypothetical protein